MNVASYGKGLCRCDQVNDIEMGRLCCIILVGLMLSQGNQEESESERGPCDNGSRGEKGDTGPWAKKWGQPLGTGTRGIRFVNILILPNSFQTYDLQNCKIINLCCFKPLNLWLVCYSSSRKLMQYLIWSNCRWIGNSLAVQWLGLGIFTARALGSGKKNCRWTKS